MDKLRQGKVLIHNWHKLAWDTQEKLDQKIEQNVSNRKAVPTVVRVGVYPSLLHCRLGFAFPHDF